MLDAEYFDGSSARAHRAQLRWVEGAVEIAWAGGRRELHPSDIEWPERRRHGPRVAHLMARAGGGSLHCRDAAAWDAFARQRPSGASESWVVRAQQSWRGVALAALLLVAVGFAGWRWGVPVASRGVVQALPPSVDRAVGEAALQGVEGRWLKPSRLDAARRAQIEAGFARMVRSAFPDAAERPTYILRFHASTIGPNAFALPGGAIVLTDELVTLMAGRDDVVLGVLAHELGHVRLRHGMRMLVQFTLVSAATAVALGDFSSVLAAAPALLGQMAYSRDAEREADAESVRLMRAAAIDPAAMAEFFERMQRWRESDEGRKQGAGFDLGIAFSSHPADDERIAFFRQAGR